MGYTNNGHGKEHTWHWVDGGGALCMPKAQTSTLLKTKYLSNNNKKNNWYQKKCISFYLIVV